MKVDWVELQYEEHFELAGISPVSFAKIQKLELLLGVIANLLNKQEQEIPLDYNLLIDDLAQKVIDFHPRVDVADTFGFDIQLLSNDEFIRLFKDGGITELNKYIAPPERKTDKPDPNPPWSSGDIQDDWLADLTYSLNGSYRDALAIVNTRSYQSVTNLLKRLSDLHKGPEGRETEQSQEFFWEQVGQMEKGEFDDFFDLQDSSDYVNPPIPITHKYHSDLKAAKAAGLFQKGDMPKKDILYKAVATHNGEPNANNQS